SWSQISGTSGQVFVVGNSSTGTASRSTAAVNATQPGASGKASNVTKFMGFTMQCVNHDWKHTSPSCFGKTTSIEGSQCPNGSSGKITTSVIRQCDGSTVRQITENTCQNSCTPKSTTTEERQCPTGKQGKITVEVTKVCFGRQPVSNQSYSNASCNCTT